MSSAFDFARLLVHYAEQMPERFMPLLQMLFSRTETLSAVIMDKIEAEELRPYFNFSGEANITDELLLPEVEITLENAPALRMVFQIEGLTYLDPHAITDPEMEAAAKAKRERLMDVFMALQPLNGDQDLTEDPTVFIHCTVQEYAQTMALHLLVKAMPLALKLQLHEDESKVALCLRPQHVTDARHTAKEVVAMMYGTILTCHIKRTLGEMRNPKVRSQALIYSDVQLAQQRALMWCLLPMLYVDTATGGSDLLGRRGAMVLEFWGVKTFDRRVTVTGKRRRGNSMGLAVCTAAIALNLQGIHLMIIVPGQFLVKEMGKTVCAFLENHRVSQQLASREETDGIHLTLFTGAADEDQATHIHIVTENFVKLNLSGPQDLRLVNVLFCERFPQAAGPLETVMMVRHGQEVPPLCLAEVLGMDQDTLDQQVERLRTEQIPETVPEEEEEEKEVGKQTKKNQKKREKAKAKKALCVRHGVVAHPLCPAENEPAMGAKNRGLCADIPILPEAELVDEFAGMTPFHELEENP